MEKIKFEKREHELFYLDIRQRVNAYLTRNTISRYANRKAWLKLCFYSIILVTSYGILLSGAITNPLTLQLLALTFGICCLLIAINAGHDAAHLCFAKSRSANKLIYTFSFALLGVSGYLWQLRHNRSHHVFPNVDGCDIDIDENPFLRLSPHHARRWYQKFQPFYAPFIYWLVSLDTIFIQDFIYLGKKDLANMRDIKHEKRQYLIFAGIKLIYLIMVLALPYHFMHLPLWQFIAGYLIMNFVISVMFILLLVGTHFAEENKFPELGAGNTLPGSWASHALDTSLDWAPQSRLANFIVGGANCHAAHHLFPGICHVHYPALSKIICETLTLHGIEYKQTTLAKMVKSHFRFLTRLSQQKELLVGIA